MAPRWLRAFEHPRVALPEAWAGPGATATLADLLSAFRTIAADGPPSATLPAIPRAIQLARAGDGGWQVASTGGAVPITGEQLEALWYRLFAAVPAAAEAVGASRAEAALLVAAGDVFPELAELTGRRVPVPFRVAGGPGFLGLFASHTHFDFPIAAAQVDEASVTSGPPFDPGADGPSPELDWYQRAAALPLPQFAYWWSATYVHGAVLSRHRAGVWFRERHDVDTAPARGARLVARLQAFHAVALDTPFGFGLEGGVLVPAR